MWTEKCLEKLGATFPFFSIQILLIIFLPVDFDRLMLNDVLVAPPSLFFFPLFSLHSHDPEPWIVELSVFDSDLSLLVMCAG